MCLSQQRCELPAFAACLLLYVAFAGWPLDATLPASFAQRPFLPLHPPLKTHTTWFLCGDGLCWNSCSCLSVYCLLHQIVEPDTGIKGRLWFTLDNLLLTQPQSVCAHFLLQVGKTQYWSPGSGLKNGLAGMDREAGRFLIRAYEESTKGPNIGVAPNENVFRERRCCCLQSPLQMNLFVPLFGDDSEVLVAPCCLS